MKNIVFKLILFTTFLSCIIGCGCLKKVKNNDADIESGASMIASSWIYNSRQLDSLCLADTLCTDLDEWIISSYTDYETGKRVTKYVYYKNIDTDYETTYIVVKLDSLYKITKRSVVE